MNSETDRPRGILTDTDRRYLLGETDYANEQSKRDARYRIRERVFNGLRDLDLVLRELEGRDLEQVLKRIDEDDVESIVAFAKYLEAAREAERKRERMVTTLGRQDNSELEKMEQTDSTEADR